MKTKKEIFLEATATTKWATVDEIIKRLDGADYWDREFRNRALLNEKKKEVRRQMKSLKDADGMPVFANVVVPDEEGGEKHVYKQETLFDVGDYEQTITYHVSAGQHHIDMAVRYRGRALARFQVQIPLPFDLPDAAKGAA